MWCLVESHTTWGCSQCSKRGGSSPFPQKNIPLSNGICICDYTKTNWNTFYLQSAVAWTWAGGAFTRVSHSKPQGKTGVGRRTKRDTQTQFPVIGQWILSVISGPDWSYRGKLSLRGSNKAPVICRNRSRRSTRGYLPPISSNIPHWLCSPRLHRLVL